VLTVRATAPGGTAKTFTVRSRVDTPEEATYYRNGGILQYVLRGLVT
jgi:aconitate hydratase